MTDEKKKTLPVVLIILFFLAYFFVCAQPMQHELSLKALWGYDLNTKEKSPRNTISNEKIFAFSASDLYGYYSSDGKLFFLETGSVPIMDTSYASMEEGSYVLKNNKKETISTLSTHYPFFAENRLFSAESNGIGLSSYDKKGNFLWNYVFQSHLSAFASSPNLVAGGTVNGNISCIDNEGKTVFSFEPGGSRLEVILGLDVSDSAKHVATVCGIDKQRLVVLEKGSHDYRVVSHKYLDSEYREPVPLVIMEDEEYVLYRRDDGVGVWGVNGKTDTMIPVKAQDFSAFMDNDLQIVYLITKNGEKTDIVVFEQPAVMLGKIPLPDNTEYVKIDGSSVYAGSKNWLTRLDFVED